MSYDFYVGHHHPSNWGSMVAYATRISRLNPADRDGKIYEVRFRLYSSSNVKVATMQNVSGNNFTTRDYADLGSYSSGTHDKSVDLEIKKDDYIAIYARYLNTSTSSGNSNMWWLLSGDNINVTNTTFSLRSTSDEALSLRGYGLEDKGNILFKFTDF